MSNSHDKEVEEANNEYLQAVGELNKLVPYAKESIPGKKVVFERWNEKYFKELGEAEAKVAEKRRKLHEAVRKWRIEKGST
jgi:hypothetical protein